MIQYDPTDWLRHLFSFRGAVLISRMGRIVQVTSFAVAVVLWRPIPSAPCPEPHMAWWAWPLACC